MGFSILEIADHFPARLWTGYEESLNGVDGTVTVYKSDTGEFEVLLITGEDEDAVRIDHHDLMRIVSTISKLEK